jgi:tRNA A-37 threonylcarbamoyl transferase component Bud32
MNTSPQVSHPGLRQLAAFAVGRLTSTERDELQAHLASCPACRSALANMPGDSLEFLCSDEPSVSGAVTSTILTSVYPDLAPPVAPPARAAPTSEKVAPPPPELVNHPRYEVVQALGAGGMGTVYKARHRVMDRTVALKVLSPRFLSQTNAVERFRREIMAAARLLHANIVSAFDAEQVGDTHFLVMEFVEGQDLARYAKQKGPIPVALACDFTRQAALGLQHAHERGMVHRDVKPQNMMLTGDGVVKVLDFGLARFASEGAAEEGGLTGPNTLMGTADYVAPEQACDARGADIRADIYSLGCTLYYLLAGRPPFPEGSTAAKIAAHLSQTPRPVTEVRPDVPDGLQQVLARMMAKAPDGRYQEPAGVVQALAPFCQKSAVPAPQGGEGRPAATAAPPTMHQGPRASTALAARGGEDGARTAPGAAIQPGRRRWLPATVAGLVGAVVLVTVIALGRHPGGTGPVAQAPASGKIRDDVAPGSSLPAPATAKSEPVKKHDDLPSGRTTRAPEAGAENPADGKERDGPVPVPPAKPPEPEPKKKGDLPAAVQVLVEGLNDEDGKVRRTSAESLGVMGARARGAVPALARRVADDVWIGGVFAHTADPHGGGKAAALEALKKLAPERVEGALLLAMKSKNPAVKSWATTELGRLNSKGEADQ